MRIGLGIGLDFTKKRGVLIAPVATAATSVTGTSFVANWNAYDGATTYYLDVSTSPTFATFVLQNQSVSAPATSYTVTGLTACTYYYYRVRAEGNKPTISIAPTLSPSGTQLTGTLITCGTGTWNNQGSTFNYQWKRNGVSISGATSVHILCK
jgi:phosphodiesterase/alkaline phosphatase D-like protein